MPYSSPRDDPATLDGLRALGAAIRRARIGRGLSQDRLEELSGIDQTVISRLERGLTPRFPIARLIRIDLVLGAPLGLDRPRRPDRIAVSVAVTERMPVGRP